MLGSLLIGGCKAKKVVLEENTISSYSEKDLYYKIKAANLQYEYLEASGTATINTPDLNVSGNFLMRLKDEETAWLVVKKFGLEVARVLIQNDTATVLNRFEKGYMQGSTQELGKKVGLGMGQKEVIDFLAGNMMIDNGEFLSMKQDSFVYGYKFAFDNLIIDYSFDSLSETVSHASFSDMSNKNASCLYNDYKVIDEVQLTSYQRILSTDNPSVGPTSITLDFKDINLTDELNFPFEIPSNYTKVNF